MSTMVYNKHLEIHSKWIIQLYKSFNDLVEEHSCRLEEDEKDVEKEVEKEITEKCKRIWLNERRLPPLLMRLKKLNNGDDNTICQYYR